MKYVVGRCPKCNSDELYESAVVPTTTNIEYWVRDNEGTVTPEYSGGCEIDWSGQRPNNADKPYNCNNCMEGPFAIGDIKFDEEA